MFGYFAMGWEVYETDSGKIASRWNKRNVFLCGLSPRWHMLGGSVQRSLRRSERPDDRGQRTGLAVHQMPLTAGTLEFFATQSCGQRFVRPNF